MRFVEVGQGEPITLTDARAARLKKFLEPEHSRAFDNRDSIQRLWRKLLLQYQGQPALEVRNIPFENAPNIEITIGAMHSDMVFAQMMDLIFQVRPVLTIRSKGKEYDDIAEGMQMFADWGVAGPWDFRSLVENCALDDVQLGTGAAYDPWAVDVRKTDVMTVRTVGPHPVSVPIEDFIVPTNSTGNIQTDRFTTMRLWLTEHELNLRKEKFNWKIERAKESAEKVDPVREQRLRMSGVESEGMSKGIYQIMDTFCYFDIDEDGIDEDLEVIWDWTSKQVLKVTYNPWDRRPFRTVVYQRRAHVFYGVGVMEMDDPYECQITELANAGTANTMLANTRGFTGPDTARSEVTVVHPGMFISNSFGEITPFPMADVYPSNMAREAYYLGLADKRVGVNELTAPLRAGGRPNATTTTALMQAAQRRFTPAFDGMREFLAGVVADCIYRTQERVKAGDQDAINLVKKVCKDKAQQLIDYFITEEIDLTEVAEVELTAASVSVNREADRQSMVMLAGLFEKYVQGMLQLEQLKMQMPQMADMAKQGQDALNAIFRRIFRTFDQISDVRSVLIEPTEQQALAPLGMADMGQQLQAMLQGPQGGGGAPPTPASPLPIAA